MAPHRTVTARPGPVVTPPQAVTASPRSGMTPPNGVMVPSHVGMAPVAMARVVMATLPVAVVPSTDDAIAWFVPGADHGVRAATGQPYADASYAS
jgi:hypothetical protein